MIDPVIKAKLLGATKSKLMWAAGLFAVMNAALIALPMLHNILTPTLYAKVNFAFAVIVAGLRWVTTEPLEWKENV